METQVMEELYQEIATQLNEMIPEDWEKVLMYTEVSEGADTGYFYYYPEGAQSPICCFDIYNIFEIDEDTYDEMHDKLMEYFRELWEEFKNNKQEPWTNLTFTLDNTGKFKIDYDYTDLSEADNYEQRIIWEYKYLGMDPSPERKRDVKIIQKYLANLQEC